jgi:hypothetical protein
MGGMKLQFSLATLLVCMMVLAVVCAASVTVPVNAERYLSIELTNPPMGHVKIRTEGRLVVYGYHRPPTVPEIALQIGLRGLPAVATTLALTWAIRCLKSRRENGQPVG